MWQSFHCFQLRGLFFFLSRGEERTWYGIPASSVEKLERDLLLRNDKVKTRPDLKLLNIAMMTPDDIVAAGKIAGAKAVRKRFAYFHRRNSLEAASILECSNN